MPKYYRSREGALTTEDAKTQLTTLGSQTAPGPLLVPGDAKFLRAVFVSGLNSGAAAVSYAMFGRLEGPGIARGSFVFPIMAGGAAVATGANQLMASKRIPVNIAVIPGQEILVFAEAVGGDADTYQVGMTLEYGDSAGEEGEIKGEITVEGDLTAVDTLVRLTAQGSVTTPSRLTPPDATKLVRLLVVVSGDCATDGEVNYLVRLSGDAIKGGEQTIIVSAESWIDVATGGDGVGMIMPVEIFKDLDIDITPNETLDINAEMVGVDTGTARIIVSAQFA